MDTNQTPQVPDFTPPTVATGNSVPPTSVVPPSGGSPTGKRKRFGLILAILIAIAVPVVSYFVYTNSQTVNTDAAGALQCNEILNGRTCADHRWADRNCYDESPYVLVQCRDNSRHCTANMDTFKVCGDGCKKINPCMLKCKDGSEAERFVDICESEPTPTPPTKIPVCVEPLVCMDPATAAQMGCIDSTAASTAPARCGLSGSNTAGNTQGFCCKPKVTPTATPEPSRTPTPTITVTPSPTPAVCVNPKIDVEVQCLTCGTQQ